MENSPGHDLRVTKMMMMVPTEDWHDALWAMGIRDDVKPEGPINPFLQQPP